MAERSGGASVHHRRSWLKPGTWHLRMRLVLVAMALLVAICAAVGVFSYASMDSFLTRQLDDRLTGASDRARDFGRPPPGGLGNRPDPLDAKGLGAGTLVGRLENGQVVSAGILTREGARATVPTGDSQVLLSLAIDGVPVGRTPSSGDYRLVADETPYGEVIVTGLPLADKQSTLASLVWTTTIVSLGGIVLIGLTGTTIIRRTMKPLEQLSEVATQVSRLPLDAGEVALAVRVPPSNAHPGTEVGSVGHALNLMLDNVARAMRARRSSWATWI